MKYIIPLLLLSFMPQVKAENPLHLREYTRKLVLSFRTEKDAENAELRPRALPANYKTAFSSRWDDSVPAHLKTCKIMRKHGMKGTFFLNSTLPSRSKDYLDTIMQENKDYIKLLLQSGCSVGLHTVSHPHLPRLKSNRHFYEYMKNRIILETVSQSPVNSQVLPYCDWKAADKKIPHSIGWAMRAAGVLSSPDLLYPDMEKHLGYPAGTLAQSKPLMPGDRNPDPEKFRLQMQGTLADQRSLSRHPSFSIGIHSLHTPEGLVSLDKIYASAAGNPEWWYCNQNEYGAYRYEAQNTVIAKKVNGRNAEFSITRIEPFELGANVPLWLEVAGALPEAASGGVLHGTAVELPHDSNRRLPDIYGYAGRSGQSADIPFVKMALVRTGGKTWEVKWDTLSGELPDKVCFTFRFPAGWARETIRKDIIPAAPSFTAEASQPAEPADDFYRQDAPYYAVQADFMLGGKHYRLYADCGEIKE